MSFGSSTTTGSGSRIAAASSPFASAGVDGIATLTPGRVHVVRLGRVVVQLRRAHAAAVRHAHDDRELHLPAGAPAVAADVGDQLVEARIREARRTASRTRGASPAMHRPTARAEDARLGERRVDAAVRAEALAQPGGGAEHAAGAADVLADDDHRRRRARARRGARRSPPRPSSSSANGASENRAQLCELARNNAGGFAYACSNRSATSASGSASASAIAARIASAASALISASSSSPSRPSRRR